MIRNILYSILLSISFINLSFAQKANNSSTRIEYISSSPVTISIKNLLNGSRWKLVNNNSPNSTSNAQNTQVAIKIQKFREGYIYSYFTLNIPPEYKGNITFHAISNDGKKLKARIFTLIPKNASFNESNPLFGDMPVNSKGDGFLDQASNEETENIKNKEKDSLNKNSISPNTTYTANPVEKDSESNEDSLAEKKLNNNNVKPQISDNLDYVPYENEAESQAEETTPIPEKTKTYIQTLINSGLFDQARSVFDNYLKEHPTNEKEYQVMTDIKISEGAKKYIEVIDKIQALLNSDFSFKDIYNEELQFNLREKFANALEATNKNKEAETQLLYLKVYFKENPYSDYHLGKFYLRQKELDKATTHFMDVLNKDPQFSLADEIYYDLGYYYYHIVGINGYNLSLNYLKKVISFGLASSYYQEAKKIVDFLEKNFFNAY